MFGWDYIDNRAIPGPCSTIDEYIDYLDSLDRNYFVACLDIGHAEMDKISQGSASEMIPALGSRLKALHIHDNDKIDDLHTLPFTKNILWDDVMKALKSINYDGEFTFEADNIFMAFPDELLMSVSKLMLDVGRYFIKKYEL